MADEELRLWKNTRERDMYEDMADLYGLLKACEQLEKAYIRDCISPDEYTPECKKLITQYKTLKNSLTDVKDMEDFMRTYQVDCPAAFIRLEKTGVPATVEYGRSGDSSEAKHVAETVQYFITVMDALKLNMVAADQVYPEMSSLIDSMNKVNNLPSDYRGKEIIRKWLVTLNQMKASEELDEEQTRQMLFDVEDAYSGFHRCLAK